jgi:hypothetical protein
VANTSRINNLCILQMKTPLNVLFMVIGYWVALFTVLVVPKFFENYNFNLIWMTVVIPNMLRFIVGNVPQLAVDRGFFLTSTVIALILTYVANNIWKQTKESVRKYECDKRKAFDLSALLSVTFAMGALATYFIGIDNSIYSNMGWESTNQGLTM